MIDYWCNAFTPDRSSLWKQVIEQDQLAIKLGAREADDFVDAAGMVARMDHAAIATLVLPVCAIADGAALDEFAHYALRTTEIQPLREGNARRIFTRIPARFGG